jgi:Excalibur calcium-binding domain
MYRLLLLAGCIVSPVFAHGGGLNAEGCHNDRKNGGYHCHAGAAATTVSSSPFLTPLGTGRLRGGSYANCYAARVARAAPIYAGQSGYGAHLDLDNDGVACE